MRTASVNQTPAVPYHTPIRGSLSTPSTIPFQGNAQYITNRDKRYKIGETVDAAKGKGLKRLQTMEAREGLRAHEQYRIVDAKMPTNDMAWVTLSVPDRKVLQMRRDIGCGTIAAAGKLDKELRAKFKPLKFEGGAKLLEIMKVVDASVSVQLSDADFGKELNAWLKKME